MDFSTCPDIWTRICLVFSGIIYYVQFDVQPNASIETVCMCI